MNPGPQLHRSLTFWSGLLIIAFTCWAWRDSRDHSSSISGEPGSVESTLHGLQIDWWPNPGGTYLDWYVHRDHISPRQYSSRWQGNIFPPPFLVHHQPDQQENHSLDPNVMADAMQMHVNSTQPGAGIAFIPYWLILPALILTWTALLFFRARRRRRAKLLQSP